MGSSTNRFKVGVEFKKGARADTPLHVAVCRVPVTKAARESDVQGGGIAACSTHNRLINQIFYVVETIQRQSSILQRCKDAAEKKEISEKTCDGQWERQRGKRLGVLI